ncbi:MAG TPA: sugar transferase [Puia sp.]|jgi:putative colanic acid biosynthesis UDP-glucose lipid carrier transferase|nr:sugar transferase [Puia sp.]
MSGKTDTALRAVGEHWLMVDPVWTYDEATDRRGYFLVKRAFDFVVAVLVIAGVLSWLLPLLALLIKLDSKGPAFFVQKRVGRNGRIFSCFKLRSMVIDGQADERPATGCDGRITRLGNWLRHTHLDELPQFLNVAVGAMSIVGPRPYMPADCRGFAKLVPDGDLRHRVKPGITGMSQAKGLHGASGKDKSVIVQRYRWDAYYVRYAGFMLDMQILWRTAGLLLGWKE